MKFLSNDIEEYIQELLEKYREIHIYKPISDYLQQELFAPANAANPTLAQGLESRTVPNMTLEGYVTNNRILNNPLKPIYIENDYKQTPTIQNQPSPVITPAPKRPIEDIIKPAVQNTLNDFSEKKDKVVDWAKNEKDILLNDKIDYSRPMIPHEKATDWLIKNVGKDLLPISSDMYTDGMTNFSRAKQNPNAEIINFKDIKDEKMKDILRQYKTKDDEQGVHYNTSSKASELFSKSPEIQKIKNDYYDKIKSGKITELPVEFDSNILKDLFYGNINKIDRHTSIQHGRLKNLKIDKDGSMTGNLIDRQDYEKRKRKNLLDISTILNNHGYNMQEKENLENNFSVIDILAKEKEEEEENLMKKLLKSLKQMFN